MKGVFVIFNLVACATATYTYIAGYEPQSNVTKHAKIDLDVESIQSGLPSNNGGVLSNCDSDYCKYSASNMDFPTSSGSSFDVWKNGQNSFKSAGLRTIRGFASGAKTKTSGNDATTDVMYKDNKAIKIMNNYWKRKGLDEYTWGMDILQAAFNGTTIPNLSGTNTFTFANVGRDFRKEVIQKGVVYFNIFPYVVWEMQDAVNDCYYGSLNANGGSVHAWDEAVAFYTGSKEGGNMGGLADLASNTDGELQFMLAEKRCQNFGTCTGDYDSNAFSGYSQVNYDLFQEFTIGRDQLLGANSSCLSLAGDYKCPSVTCADVDDTMDKVTTLMLVPFLQGVQRYLYKTKSTQKSKEAGELFAFATIMLPFIDAVNANAAELLYQRAWKLDYTTVTDFKTIKYAVEGTYSSMGVGNAVGLVNCGQVGELVDNGVVLSEQCTDPVASSDDKSDENLVIGLAVGLGVPLFCVICMAIYFYMLQRNAYLKLDEFHSINTNQEMQEV